MQDDYWIMWSGHHLESSMWHMGLWHLMCGGWLSLWSLHRGMLEEFINMMKWVGVVVVMMIKQVLSRSVIVDGKHGKG